MILTVRTSHHRSTCSIAFIKSSRTPFLTMNSSSRQHHARLRWLVLVVFASFSSLSVVTASTRRADCESLHASKSVAFVPTGTAQALPLPPKTQLPLSPPTGAIYKKTLRIPVLGRQIFSLRILSDRRAHLQINGVMNVDEILHYKVKPSGAFSMPLPEELQRVLRKYRTRLVEFGYDWVTDLPYVVVSPPLPTKIRIQLVREAPAAPVVYQESLIVFSDFQSD